MRQSSKPPIELKVGKVPESLRPQALRKPTNVLGGSPYLLTCLLKPQDIKHVLVHTPSSFKNKLVDLHVFQVDLQAFQVDLQTFQVENGMACPWCSQMDLQTFEVENGAWLHSDGLPLVFPMA